MDSGRLHRVSRTDDFNSSSLSSDLSINHTDHVRIRSQHQRSSSLGEFVDTTTASIVCHRKPAQCVTVLDARRSPRFACWLLCCSSTGLTQLRGPSPFRLSRRVLVLDVRLLSRPGFSSQGCSQTRLCKSLGGWVSTSSISGVGYRYQNSLVFVVDSNIQVSSIIAYFSSSRRVSWKKTGRVWHW